MSSLRRQARLVVVSDVDDFGSDRLDRLLLQATQVDGPQVKEARVQTETAAPPRLIESSTPPRAVPEEHFHSSRPSSLSAPAGAPTRWAQKGRAQCDPCMKSLGRLSLAAA